MNELSVMAENGKVTVKKKTQSDLKGANQNSDLKITSSIAVETVWIGRAQRYNLKIRIESNGLWISYCWNGWL